MSKLEGADPGQKKVERLEEKADTIIVGGKEYAKQNSKYSVFDMYVSLNGNSAPIREYPRDAWKAGLKKWGFTKLDGQWPDTAFRAADAYSETSLEQMRQTPYYDWVTKDGRNKLEGPEGDRHLEE
jgi:hypothetical protein